MKRNEIYKRSKETWRREHKNEIEDSRIVLNATEHEKTKWTKWKKKNASEKSSFGISFHAFLQYTHWCEVQHRPLRRLMVKTALAVVSSTHSDGVNCELSNVAKIKLYGKVVCVVRSHYNTLASPSASQFCKLFGWIAYDERALRLDLLEKWQRIFSVLNHWNQRGELRKTFYFMD